MFIAYSRSERYIALRNLRKVGVIMGNNVHIKEAFQKRARLLLEQSAVNPVPDSDKARRYLYYAIARLGLQRETELALHHIELANDEPGEHAMFFRYANMDAYLRFSHLYSTRLIDKVKTRMLIQEQFELASGTENHKIMNAAAGYLTSQTWPDWQHADRLMKQCSNYLDRYFYHVAHFGQGEFDSTTYSAMYLNALATLYDYANDPMMKKKAGMMLDWYLANTAGDWLNGIFTGAHSRDYHPTETFGNAAAGTTTAWLYFGGRMPDLRVGEPHYSVINALSAYSAPDILVCIAQERSHPFEHVETHDVTSITSESHDLQRTLELTGASKGLKGLGYISRAGVRKYTYVASEYALGSMVDGKQGDVIWSGQMRRWSLDWDSNQPSSTLFFNHPFPDFGSQEEPYTDDWQGSSPYEQVVQHQGALIALYHIPAGETYKYGPRQPFPSDRDPYIDGFFSGEAISHLIENPDGWLFAHGGTVLIAVRLLKPYRWIADRNGNRRLRSEGFINAVIVEAASPNDYSDNSDSGLNEGQKRAAELERYHEAVINRTHVDAAKLESPTPSISYTALSGDVLLITYDGERSLNGKEIRYDEWPLIRNPFIESHLNSGILELRYKEMKGTLDYRNWVKA